MITPIIPTIPDSNDVVMLELDRPRELRLGHKALKRFSALTGCSMTEMEQAVQRYDKLACLMYVMLAVDAEKHGETLSVEQADDLLEAVPIYQQMQCCAAAIHAAFGDGSGQDDADREQSEPDPPVAAGIGGGV